MLKHKHDMQLNILKQNPTSQISLKNILMKNMGLIGIVLLANISIPLFLMKANDTCFSMKDRWQYCFTKWDDQIQIYLMKQHHAKHAPGVRLKQYQIQSLIGSGGYAKVYKAINNDQQEVAIKCVPQSSFKNHNNLVGELHLTEKSNMIAIQSQYVVKFIEDFKQNNYSYIVMEYCNQGDIEKLWLSKDKHFSEQESINYITQIIQGLKDMHQINIMHRDIKIRNILLHNGQIKIADLGFSKQIQKGQKETLCLGMLGYMAPEVIQSIPYSSEADIFSLGALLYLFLYGKLPFCDKNHQTFLHSSKKQIIQHSENISPQTRNLIDRMLKYDPKDRILWNELYQYFL